MKVLIRALGKAISEGDTEKVFGTIEEMALGLPQIPFQGMLSLSNAACCSKKYGLAALATKVLGKYGDEAIDVVERINIDHLKEMKELGVKNTLEGVRFIHKMPDDKIVFLEKGHQAERKGDGLAHITRPDRAKNFADKGM